MGMKIRQVRAENAFGKYYTWSVWFGLWDAIPEWLIDVIKKEMPEYKITIEYF